MHEPPPNIVLVLARHWHAAALGAAGHPDVQTPNLDALCAHGVRFTQAVTPATEGALARAALLTGRHPLRPARASLPVAARLKAAGYTSAAIGGVATAAESLGFDHVCEVDWPRAGDGADGYQQWLVAEGHDDATTRWDRVTREAAPLAYWRSLGALRSALPEYAHSTAWIGSQAVRWLQSVTEPFFLCAGFLRPAHPYDPCAPWDRLYRPDALRLPENFRLPVRAEDLRRAAHFDPAAMTEARLRRVLAFYYANVSFLDAQLGRILATLTARGITRNVIVVTSDHGEYLGHHGLLGNGQSWPYDSVLRVPFLVAGLPGQRRGEEDDALIETSEFASAALHWAGMRSVEESPLAQRLYDAQHEHPRVVQRAVDGAGTLVARSRGHKLMVDPATAAGMLFDLARDPHERENRYGDPALADIQAALEEELAPEASH